MTTFFNFNNLSNFNSTPKTNRGNWLRQINSCHMSDECNELLLFGHYTNLAHARTIFRPLFPHVCACKVPTNLYYLCRTHHGMHILWFFHVLLLSTIHSFNSFIFKINGTLFKLIILNYGFSFNSSIHI